MSIWKPAPQTSVRALLVSPDRTSVCLVRREKKGRLYYVAPGGGLEKGESALEGLGREVREETGLEFVRPTRLGAVHFENRMQIYFSAEATGRLIKGEGVEHSLLWQKDNGLFHPEWVPFEKLSEITFVSETVKQLMIKFPLEGWPKDEFKLQERTRTTSPLKVS